MIGFGLRLSKRLVKAINPLDLINNYFQPDGIFTYKSPDGSNYIRP
jgi:hypothetical protein